MINKEFWEKIDAQQKHKKELEDISEIILKRDKES